MALMLAGAIWLGLPLPASATALHETKPAFLQKLQQIRPADHMNIADVASCRARCQRDMDKCVIDCEDLHGDSPQGEGCKENCRRVKRDVCRPRC
jgi:hypothetical protein